MKKEHIEILEKYNIDYKNKSIVELLDFLDEEMLKYFDKDYNPTPQYRELQRLYDELYDLEDTK